MSTTIYEGFRIQGQSVEQIFRNLMAMRPEFAAKSVELARNFTLRVAIQTFDENFVKDSPPGDAPDWYLNALRSLFSRQDQIRLTRRRDPVVDFEVQLSLLPLANPQQVLCIPFVEHPELRKLLQKIPGYEEFGYWNSSDKPDELSEEDWDQREHLWDLALPTGVPARDGLTVEVLGTTGGLYATENLSSLTQEQIDQMLQEDDLSLEHRAREAAWSLSYPQYEVSPDSESHPHVGVFSALKRIQKSPEYAANVEMLKHRLPARLTVKDLTGRAA